MARHAASHLVELLTAAQESRCGFVDDEGTLRPLRPGDIAILVRNRKEAAKVRQELQRRGLKSVYLSDRDSVYASAEAADVVLLVDQLDRVLPAIRIARRSRFIALQSVIAGMGLSFLAMIAAAFGHLPPVEGALLQEAIDVAVIFNALRALRG